MSVNVTRHAEKRAKQRLGLPRSAVRRMAHKAYFEGARHEETEGRTRAFLDALYLMPDNSVDTVRVHGEFIYLFAGRTLITVLRIPSSGKWGSIVEELRS